jgi:hypothetical protein
MTRQSCTRIRYSGRPRSRVTFGPWQSGSAASSSILPRIKDALFDRNRALSAILEKRISIGAI